MTDRNLIEKLQHIEDNVSPVLISQWRRRASGEYIDRANDPDIEIGETYQNYMDRRLIQLYDAMISALEGLNPCQPRDQANMQLGNIYWEGEPDD